MLAVQPSHLWGVCFPLLSSEFWSVMTRTKYRLARARVARPRLARVHLLRAWRARAWLARARLDPLAFVGMC